MNVDNFAQRELTHYKVIIFWGGCSVAEAELRFKPSSIWPQSFYAALATWGQNGLGKLRTRQPCLVNEFLSFIDSLSAACQALCWAWSHPLDPFDSLP